MSDDDILEINNIIAISRNKNDCSKYVFNKILYLTLICKNVCKISRLIKAILAKLKLDNNQARKGITQK